MSFTNKKITDENRCRFFNLFKIFIHQIIKIFLIFDNKKKFIWTHKVSPTRHIFSLRCKPHDNLSVPLSIFDPYYVKSKIADEQESNTRNHGNSRK